MNKSAFTFKSSCENFIELAEKNGRRVYFWTFTFKECTTVKEGSKKWTQLLQALKRNFFRIAGVRRFELHPGGHGLHIHCLFDARLDVNKVRPIAKKFGFGRIHVVRVAATDAKKQASYLAKYLSKSDRPFCFKHRRLWANIGEYVGFKVKNCICDSPFIRFYRKIRNWLQNKETQHFAYHKLWEWHPHLNVDDLHKPRCLYFKLLWIWEEFRPYIVPSRDLEPQLGLSF